MKARAARLRAAKLPSVFFAERKKEDKWTGFEMGPLQTCLGHIARLGLRWNSCERARSRREIANPRCFLFRFALTRDQCLTRSWYQALCVWRSLGKRARYCAVDALPCVLLAWSLHGEDA